MKKAEQLLEDWLDRKRYGDNSSAATVRKYRADVIQMIQWLRKEAQLDPLRPTQDALQAYAGAYLIKKRGLSTRTRKRVIAALRGFYAWAHERGHAEVNYGAWIPIPKARNKLPVTMSLEAAERLIWAPDLSTFMGLRDAAILSVLIGCGLRVAGLVNMNESSLHFESYGGTEQLSVITREKGEKERMVPAPDETRLLVRTYLGHPDLEQIDRELQDGDRVLFVSLRNRNVTPADYRGEARRLSDWAVRDMLRKYGEQAGLPPEICHPHAARHLYGTELVESDVPEAVLQMLLGHEDANTSKIYTHLAQRKLREQIGKGNPLSKIRTPVSDLLARMG